VAPTLHTGSLTLAGIDVIWVVYEDGVTSIETVPPLDTLSGS